MLSQREAFFPEFQQLPIYALQMGGILPVTSSLKIVRQLLINNLLLILFQIL